MGAQAQGQGPGARLRQRAAARRRCGLCHRPDRRGRCAAALLSEPILKALRIGDIQPRQQLFPRDRRSWHDPPGPDPDALPGDLQATRDAPSGLYGGCRVPAAGWPAPELGRATTKVGPRAMCAPVPCRATAKAWQASPLRAGSGWTACRRRRSAGERCRAGRAAGASAGKGRARAGNGWTATGRDRRALAQGFSAEVGPVTRVEKGRGRPDTRMIFRRLRSGRRWGEHDGNSTGRARS